MLLHNEYKYIDRRILKSKQPMMPFPTPLTTPVPDSVQHLDIGTSWLCLLTSRYYNVFHFCEVQQERKGTVDKIDEENRNFNIRRLKEKEAEKRGEIITKMTIHDRSRRGPNAPCTIYSPLKTHQQGC